MKQIANPVATIRVVMTPGCPAKQQDTPFARGNLFYFATRQRAPSSLVHFVLYVSNSAVRQKWVLNKTSDDFTHLRKNIRRVGNGCKDPACCGHLQRLIKTSMNACRRRRREHANAGIQYDQCHVFQAYANDLVQVVLGIGHNLQCQTLQQMRHILEEFLDVASHCTNVFDRVLYHDDPVAATSMLVLKQPLQTGIGCGDGSGDSCECPICCGNLADDKTGRLLCGHNYHAKCLQVWLNLQPTCPVCRVQLGKEVEPE
uniref:RING-type domain-containing protein n=1 Tax=Hyaloperonospora arabidopsidis (strain Emoy2) TaxID=559515 RepID=M4BZ21_HYAAE